MKKINNIKIVFAVLLIFSASSCDKTENEEDLFNVFIGTGSYNIETQKLREYSYFDDKRVEFFYDADFDANSDQRPWNEFESEEFGEAYYMGPIYKVTSKSGHFHWVDYNLVNYDQSRDFQIEFYFSIYFDNTYSDSYAGMVYNSSKTQSGIGFYIEASDNEYKLIIRNNAKKENIFVSPPEDYIDDSGLFTVRKIGDKVSYFRNREFICETEYEYGKASGFAYSIPDNSIMAISKLTITYIDL